MLQFGHGCDAVETFNVDATAVGGSKLQFGHGCDAVETVYIGVTTDDPPQLQFGHGCDAVETSLLLSRRGRWPCFNSATAVMPWKHRAFCSWHGEPPDPLQFGHGCDAVETS